MKCVRVRGQNSDFTKPTDWNENNDGSCGVLPVRREIGKGGRPYLYSNWKPDERELAILNAGGVVELLCVGVQPPVAVGVTTGVVEEPARKDKEA